MPRWNVCAHKEAFMEGGLKSYEVWKHFLTLNPFGNNFTFSVFYFYLLQQYMFEMFIIHLPVKNALAKNMEQIFLALPKFGSQKTNNLCSFILFTLKEPRHTVIKKYERLIREERMLSIISIII